MTSITTWPRRALHWVRDHILTGLIALLTAALSTIVLLAASGLLLSPTAPAAQAPPTTSTTTTVPSSPATLDTSPATVVVASVMGQLRNVTGFTFTNPSFATTDPLLASCASSIIPVAQMARSLTLSSASLEVVVDVNVYGAGLGGRVLARTLRSTSACAGDYVQSSSLTGLEGFMASSTDVSGSSILEVTARVGDVVFSLYAFPAAYQSASSATLAIATVVIDALTPDFLTNLSLLAANARPVGLRVGRDNAFLDATHRGVLFTEIDAESMNGLERLDNLATNGRDILGKARLTLDEQLEGFHYHLSWLEVDPLTDEEWERFKYHLTIQRSQSRSRQKIYPHFVLNKFSLEKMEAAGHPVELGRFVLGAKSSGGARRTAPRLARGSA